MPRRQRAAGLSANRLPRRVRDGLNGRLHPGARITGRAVGLTVMTQESAADPTATSCDAARRAPFMSERPRAVSVAAAIAVAVTVAVTVVEQSVSRTTATRESV